MYKHKQYFCEFQSKRIISAFGTVKTRFFSVFHFESMNKYSTIINGIVIHLNSQIRFDLKTWDMNCVWFILTDRCSSTHDTFPYQDMHENSSYWWVYRLSSVLNAYEMWTSHLFEIENQALCDEITYWWETWFPMHAWMWINSLIGWEQVREQVSTYVQQRDKLDSRMICNVIQDHLFWGLW